MIHTELLVLHFFLNSMCMVCCVCVYVCVCVCGGVGGGGENKYMQICLVSGVSVYCLVS